jgi:DNA-binding XRE family transcriptional regulator
MQNEYSIISDSGREVTPTSLLGRRIIAAAKRYDGPRPDDPRGKPLADLVRAWRTFRKKPLNTAEAAEVLGMPARTIEGIEQGRPFRYEKLLRLALESA